MTHGEAYSNFMEVVELTNRRRIIVDVAQFNRLFDMALKSFSRDRKPIVSERLIDFTFEVMRDAYRDAPRFWSETKPLTWEILREGLGTHAPWIVWCNMLRLEHLSGGPE